MDSLIDSTEKNKKFYDINNDEPVIETFEVDRTYIETGRTLEEVYQDYLRKIENE